MEMISTLGKIIFAFASGIACTGGENTARVEGGLQGDFVQLRGVVLFQEKGVAVAAL